MGNKLTRRRTVVDERFTRTQGLYQHKGVDARKLRRLVLNGQLAPCYPGAEDCAIEFDECPICFLYYPSLNRSKCCTKGICTECFLQIKSPNSTRPTQCPFCKTSSYVVEYRGAKTVEEKGVEQAEEQKVIEAKIRMRQKELHDEEERMLRREEIQGEDNVPDRFRRNFSNLHGFTIPTNEVEMHGQTSSDEASLTMLSVSDSAIQQVQSCQSELTSERVAAGETGSESSSEGTIATPGPTARPNGSSFQRITRGDDFDLDLEEIMVMEAIWLSIQEQGQLQQEGQHGSVRVANHHLRSAGDAAGIGDNCQDTARSSAMGGLAGAIAALAERQAATVGSSTPDSQASCQAVAPDQPSVNDGGNSLDASQNNGTTILGICETSRSLGTSTLNLREIFHNDDGTSALATPTMTSENALATPTMISENVQEAVGTELEVPQEHPEEKELVGDVRPQAQDRDGGQELNSWIEVSIESGRAISPLLRRESRGSLMSDGMLDHSSEAVEVGTSFSSSVPSASDLPWENPDFIAAQSADEVPATGQPLAVLPDSYEEQMMLAMALSLAEAQAQAWRQ